MQAKKNKSGDKATVKVFWAAGLRNRRLLVIASLFSVGTVLLNMAVPFLVGKILAAVAVVGGDPGRYIPAFIALALTGFLCNRYGFMAMLAHQARTMSYLQARTMDTLLRRSVGFHNNTVGGKLVSDAIDLPQAYSMIAGAVYANIIPFGLTLLIGTGVVFFESWKLGLVVLFMVSTTIISGILDSRKRSELRVERLRATKEVTGHLADTILNVFTVKSFAREHAELSQHDGLNQALLNYRLRDWRTAARNGSNRVGALLLMQLGFILLTIKLVHDDPSLLGVGIFVFSFIIMLSNRLFEINAILRTVEDGFLQASPMVELFSQQPEIQDAPGARPLRAAKGAITMKNVHFRYEDGSSQQSVFDNLQVTIKPGEKIGLVGPSGGGKSTLTRLLLRFEDIDSGTITIDKQDIREVTQESLRNAIAYVPQEPLLFHRSIHENIAYSTPEATDEDVRAAATSAFADEFITKLPKGYDTIVGERGVKLSGGQRQRIAIARAILKRAPILLLDEATSALDSESEVLIQEALWQLMQKRTALVIAHRLSTIQKMDRIIVLENGAIAEQGTHAQLLKKKGTYAKLWAHQSGGFIED